MNFFCSSAEFDQYVTDMELDPNTVIKADIKRALKEAKATFEEGKKAFPESEILSSMRSGLKGKKREKNEKSEEISGV